MMHISELKDGQMLKCVGDYADCIYKGQEYIVTEDDGDFYITCNFGKHELISTADDDGNLPEFIVK